MVPDDGGTVRAFVGPRSAAARFKANEDKTKVPQETRDKLREYRFIAIGAARNVYHFLPSAYHRSRLADKHRDAFRPYHRAQFALLTGKNSGNLPRPQPVASLAMYSHTGIPEAGEPNEKPDGRCG
jgi:hypothetical protein